MPAQNMLWSHPYCNDLPEFTKHSQNYMFSIPEKQILTRFYGFFWWLHPLMSPSAPHTKALGRVFPTASLRSLIAFSVRLTWGHGFGPKQPWGLGVENLKISKVKWHKWNSSQKKWWVFPVLWMLGETTAQDPADSLATITTNLSKKQPTN